MPEITIKDAGGDQRYIADHISLIAGKGSTGRPAFIQIGEGGQVLVKDVNSDRDSGLTGSEYIDDTAEHEGVFIGIQALADTVVAAMTSSDITGTLAGMPIPAGTTIRGTITSITLTSGKVLALNK